MPEHLQASPELFARPAPPGLPAMTSPFADKNKRPDTPRQEIVEGSDGDVSPTNRSLENLPMPSPSLSTSTTTRKNVSFFDVGGLLENGSMGPPSPSISNSRSVTLVSSGGSHTIATDFATTVPTPPQSRRGSRAFLADMGATLTPHNTRSDVFPHQSLSGYGYTRRSSLPGSRLRAGAPTGVLGPMLERQETQVSLQDAGGLLSGTSPASSGDVRTVEQIPEIDHDDNDDDDFTNIRPNDSIRLQDLGSFLASNRRTDLDSSDPRRPNNRGPQTRGVASPSRAASTARDQSGYESMSLEDPGGLLSR